uniref:Alpha/beta hydrolase n=1 Tax=Macrostomum lignano TaxID=282301 RepID=A0A1I8J9G3_9PLAT
VLTVPADIPALADLTCRLADVQSEALPDRQRARRLWQASGSWTRRIQGCSVRPFELTRASGLRPCTIGPCCSAPPSCAGGDFNWRATARSGGVRPKPVDTWTASYVRDARAPDTANGADFVRSQALRRAI